MSGNVKIAFKAGSTPFLIYWKRSFAFRKHKSFIRISMNIKINFKILLFLLIFVIIILRCGRTLALPKALRRLAVMQS